MKHLGALFAACLLLMGCVPEQEPGQIYRGSYFQNFEASTFTPEGTNESWCVNAGDMAKAQPADGRSSTADVIVRGELSPEGKYCNLGAYRHVLKVYEVIEVSNIRSGG
jgi:hypothetical protein